MSQTEIDSRLKDISEIRQMMERSSKFLSLSGLSGISAGIIALIGAFMADHYLKKGTVNIFSFSRESYPNYHEIVTFLITDAAIILIFALGLAVFFSTRMATRKGLPVWTKTSKWMIASLFVPLLTGGLFCLMMVYYGLLFLVPSAMLIFYGLSLLNASKYTVTEIRYLALSEIFLGLIASVWTVYGLIIWAIGFGVLHILYGTVLYYRYEK